MKDANVALVRQAILTVLDERRGWDFSNDEHRVDFADLVASFIPSEKSKINPIGLVKMIGEQRDECADALRELVTLKAMKDGFGVEPFGQHNNAAARQDYERRKGPAWEAARKAIAKVPTYAERLDNIFKGIADVE